MILAEYPPTLPADQWSFTPASLDEFVQLDRMTSGRIMFRMSDAEIAVSVVVPTYQEGVNLTPLVERIDRAMRDAGFPYEVIVVDDNSQDETESVAAQLATEYPFRLIVRTEERGLSSAVLCGYAEAKHDIFVVMDADLQHPPEVLPDLVRAVSGYDCDFAIGTRYVKGGKIVKDWPFSRRIISLGSKWLARPLTPLSDPLSGFFAIQRSTWERVKAKLDPIGYKIALEVYVKAGCRRSREVTITFGTRQAGESKLTSAVAWHYLGHLWKLYWYKLPWLMWLFGGTALAIITLTALYAFRDA